MCQKRVQKTEPPYGYLLASLLGPQGAQWGPKGSPKYSKIDQIASQDLSNRRLWSKIAIRTNHHYTQCPGCFAPPWRPPFAPLLDPEVALKAFQKHARKNTQTRTPQNTRKCPKCPPNGGHCDVNLVPWGVLGSPFSPRARPKI